MTLQFRNVDASPSDPVSTWPYEALVTALERGLVGDWQPVIAELRHTPWGRTARRVETYLGYAEPSPVTRLFTLLLERIRADAEADERAEVASRVRTAIAHSGRTAAAFAQTVGTSPSRLSTYATGSVIPSAAMLVRIERAAERLAREEAD
jgi:hypothetical protein